MKKVLISIAIIAVVAVAYFVFMKPEPEETVRRKPKEPAFEKQGELAFLNTEMDTLRAIDIEVSMTNAERAQGLMHRSNMLDTQGMLFIFEREEEQSFWMKNTIISLDILYVNKDKEIVTIYEHTTPFSENPIPSFKPALYVVEVNAGFCDAFGIKEGDRINFVTSTN